MNGVRPNTDNVDITGFSRGSVEAVKFSQRIAELKAQGTPPYNQLKEIRFMGIYDPVPGPAISPNLQIPSMVKKTAIAYSLDEKRNTFAPAMYTGNNITRQAFRGGHSDIGGGYKDRGLANIALAWMIKQGQLAGGPFKCPKMPLSSDGYTNKLVRHQEDHMYDSIYFISRDIPKSIPRDPSVAKLTEVSSDSKESFWGVDIANKEYKMK